MNQKRISKPFLTLTAALLLFASLACRMLTPGPNIIGTWEGQYGGQTVIMIFQQNGSYEIQMGSGSNSVSASGTYTIDTSQTPIHLDINMEGMDPVLTIVEFVDANTLRMENAILGTGRPTTFKDPMVLKRTGR